jgi:hypothetical protein
MCCRSFKRYIHLFFCSLSHVIQTVDGEKKQRLTARQRRLIKAGKLTLEDALSGVGSGSPAHNKEEGEPSHPPPSHGAPAVHEKKQVVIIFKKYFV